MPTAHTSPPTPLTILVDDVRGFKDERPALVARSSGEALALLEGLGDRRIDHLWLDHDLSECGHHPPGHRPVGPAGSHGVTAERGTGPHSQRQRRAGHWMRLELEGAGYAVVSSYSLGMWTREA